MRKELKRVRPVNAARMWQGIPGVKYPEEVAAERLAEAERLAAERREENGRRAAERRAARGAEEAGADTWGVTTDGAAVLLGMTRQSAWRVLRGEGLECTEVLRGNGRPVLYWPRHAVERLAARRAARRDVPAGYVLVEEASALTGLTFRRLQQLARACRMRAERVLWQEADGRLHWRWAFCKEDLV